MGYRRGFTLVEVVIVMVVIGVLASVGLATQRSFIDKSRGAEARQILLSGYAGYQRLLADDEEISASKPLSWPRMGMTDPNLIAGRYFNYSIRPTSNNPTRLEAKRGVVVSGCAGTASHEFRLDLGTGRLTESLS